MSNQNLYSSQEHDEYTPEKYKLSKSTSDFEESVPRLGRRESEPHSIEITYLYNVLKTNFIKSRVMWDLHHYFIYKGEKIDLQYDISFFKDFDLPDALPSYESKEHNNKIPDLAVNILSKSTWRKDFIEIVSKSQNLKLPIYVIFPSYHVTSNYFKPPFLRVYVLQDNGKYEQYELREITLLENSDGTIKEINPQAIISVGDKLPFRFGLMKRKQKLIKGLPLFRMVLIKPDSLELFKSFSEKETSRADKEKQNRILAEEKVIKAEERAIDAEKRAIKAEEELRKLKKQSNK